MRFVHLVPQPSIGRIKKDGIRLGGGRRGRGVYAVPLMLLRGGSWPGDDRQPSSAGLSSESLWRWLGDSGLRHRRLAAIHFTTEATHWPARLYLACSPQLGLDWLQDVAAEDYRVEPVVFERVRNSHRQGFSDDLELSIAHPRTVGPIMKAAQEAGFWTMNRYDDSLEIVFPQRVSSRLIRRITPLYRTNEGFKQRRQGQRRGRRSGTGQRWDEECARR